MKAGVVGPGYQIRTKKIRSILIHSMNNPRGNTTFEDEIDFLYNSRDVTAEYAVGEDEVIELLDPSNYFTYHAGYVRNSKFSNAESIGIEVHYSPKDREQPINSSKIVLLTELVQFLMEEFTLTPNDISLHRLEAIYPPGHKYAGKTGRKQDPNFWSDAQFEQWRSSLLKESMIADTILNGIQTDPIHLHRALNKYSPKLTTEEKESIVSAYTTYGELTTIGNLYPFAQAAHETGWFSSERWVKSKNPAGLGADDTGAWGHTFKNPAEGILAQYAHLLCYAVPDDQLSPIQKMIARISPRRISLLGAYGLGVAGNRWQGLSLKWNSPRGNPQYGNKILEIGEGILRL